MSKLRLASIALALIVAPSIGFAAEEALILAQVRPDPATVQKCVQRCRDNLKNCQQRCSEHEKGREGYCRTDCDGKYGWTCETKCQ